MNTAPTRVVQTVGPEGQGNELLPDGRNRVVLGDCLPAMRGLPEASFTFIYLDPPFFTRVKRGMRHGDDAGLASYDDRWAGGLAGYLGWLEARLEAARRLLTADGALFLHLDWHAVHYAKVALDRIFGMGCFQNEFIWYYGGGGASGSRFGRKHDTILYYTREERGGKFYADRVRTPHRWDRGQRRADGSARDYARGKLADDVWEHHSLMPWGGENMGYPTQKPEALLERLMVATTDAGDVVGDFCCGAGTTAAVAQRLGRRWVVADVSRAAVCLTAERIAETLCPGCGPEGGTARERARARYAEIMANEVRVGVSERQLGTCRLSIIPDTGFRVEEWAVEGAAAEPRAGNEE